MITTQTINEIIRDVAELPDRSSPEDWPEAMLVTAVELEVILNERLGSTYVSEAQLLATRSKIEAVKLYRAKSGAPLQEAASYIKSIWPDDIKEGSV